MEIINYTLKAYFDQKKSPCLSFNVFDLNDPCIKLEAQQHRSDYFQVVLLEQGSLQQNIELENISLATNHITVVFPHQINAITTKTAAKGIVVQFDEVLFCSDLLKNELISYNHDLMHKLNHVILETATFKKIYAYAYNIFELFKELTPIKKEQIRFYIKIMLLELIEAAHQNYEGLKTPEQQDQFAKFKSLIETHFKQERTVGYYTSALQLTPKKLNEICKNRTGQTALNIIHERILTEIKRLLLFSGKSHKEIAFELGFDSPSALNKFVYAKLKETPTELKQELSQIYKF
ncbi:AraC family transcriptional regulator [Zunongwangia atlantica]|uniref:Transcriptional regulator, AraC family protein n=1 Tax=Zunongwangia atlantica 22II14-10F7 TaxID=1185767 RepID=A0A1Y1T742_9FLAO|nr:helix-turn-helix domain-containing protein [Zunongwangia atlantica]ORL46404.1 transcriptional regulator, AraC family protein [Zunongwangia atlantica 22II14-10F7]